MMASRLNAQWARWSSSVSPIMNWLRCLDAEARNTLSGMPFSQLRTPYFLAPSSITLALRWVARVRATPRDNLSETQATVLSAQADLLENLIVGTVGVRRDRVLQEQGVYERDARGVFPDVPHSSGTLTTNDRGRTYSVGAVLNATRFVSLFANRATNFVPSNQSVVNIDGVPAAPIEGQGYDVGLRFSLARDRIQGLMERLGMEEGVPIEHGMITRAVANAQSKVEGHNFDIRKHLLEYDDVLNKQRLAIYSERDRIFVKSDLSEDVTEMLRAEISRRVLDALDRKSTRLNSSHRT